MDRYTNLVESNSDNSIITNSKNSKKSRIKDSRESKEYLSSNDNNNIIDSVIQIQKDLTSKEKKEFRERCLEILQMEINCKGIDNEKKKEDKKENENDYNYFPEEEVVYCRNIHKTYLIGLEGVPALRGVSLKVKKGEFLIILGTSGGGKKI
jgi:ABC-type glutathione transport system ATPase component